MNGKNRCKILKDIRRQIAESNDIEFITSECKYQGDCKGTCPKCESEVRYLERELEKRRKLGYAITVAGLATVITTTSTGCALHSTMVDGELVIEKEPPIIKGTDDVIDGEMVELPEIYDLVGLSTEEMIDRLSHESASYLRTLWNTYLTESREERLDVYQFEKDNQRYTVYITFNEADKISLVLLYADEETQTSDTTDTREIEEELMGDIVE